MTQPIFQKRIRNITTNREHKADTDPNLKTPQIEPVRGQLPSQQQIVHQRQRERGGDTVIGEHVRHHRDLVVHGGSGPDEFVELGGDGTSGEPADEGVEDQFGTSVSVFFLQ